MKDDFISERPWTYTDNNYIDAADGWHVAHHVYPADAELICKCVNEAEHNSIKIAELKKTLSTGIELVSGLFYDGCASYHQQEYLNRLQTWLPEAKQILNRYLAD